MCCSYLLVPYTHHYHCCHSARRHKAVSKSWKVSPTALRMVLAFKDDGSSYHSEVGYSLYLEDHPMYQVVSKWGWNSIVSPLLHLLHGIIYLGNLVFRVSKTKIPRFVDDDPPSTSPGPRGAAPSRSIVIVVGSCRRDIKWYPNLYRSLISVDNPNCTPKYIKWLVIANYIQFL